MRAFQIFSTAVFVLALCSGVVMGQSRPRSAFPSSPSTSAPVMSTSAPTVGKNYALLIGINDYSHNNAVGESRRTVQNEEWCRLEKLLYCSADMTELGKALEKGNAAYKGHTVLLTSDSENAEYRPTLENIEIHLNRLLKKVTPVDSVLVAFAGHGISLPVRKGESRFDQYLCPMDAEVVCDTDSGCYRVDTLIRRKDLDERLQQSQAGVKVMIIDACRSLPERGDQDLLAKTRNIGRNDPTSLGSTDIKSFNAGELSKAKGLFCLASCSSNQKAIELADYGHGIYTYHLIKGLQGAADGFRDAKKGRITLRELSTYAIEQTVADVQARYKNLTQEPTFSVTESNGEDFVIAYCEMPTPVSNVQPAGTGSTLPNVPTTVGSFFSGGNQGNNGNFVNNAIQSNSYNRPSSNSSTKNSSGGGFTRPK